MTEEQLDSALDLVRRLPPQHCETNLARLIELLPELQEDLLSSVDQPLKVGVDRKLGKEYLLCDYNRDGDSYRSPWSGIYDPPLEEGVMPSESLRKLEVALNAAFEHYRDMYFEGGVSSAYLWQLEHGFAGVILLKKVGSGSSIIKGCWDSIHVIEVQLAVVAPTIECPLALAAIQSLSMDCPLQAAFFRQASQGPSQGRFRNGGGPMPQLILRTISNVLRVGVYGGQEKSTGRSAHYKLTSTVMLWLQTSKQDSGIQNLGGSVTRQIENDLQLSDFKSHVGNIGKMVEVSYTTIPASFLGMGNKEHVQNFYLRPNLNADNMVAQGHFTYAPFRRLLRRCQIALISLTEMENKMRSSLNEIYFGKTHDIVRTLRSLRSLAEKDKQTQLQTEIARAISSRQDTSQQSGIVHELNSDET